MTQAFVKRQNTFEAIQFTGGEESAKQVGDWLFEHFKITSMYQSSHERKDGSPRGEIVFMNRRDKMYPGYWATIDSYHGELTIFTEDEFSRLFVAQEELVADSVAEEKFDGACEESEGTRVTPPLEKFELDGLFSLGGVLHGRRVDNGNFVPIVIAEDNPTLIDNAGDKSDESPSDDLVLKAFKQIHVTTPEGNIYEVVKYSENTLFKVRDALLDDAIRSSDVDRIINLLINAGILFRERI